MYIINSILRDFQALVIQGKWTCAEELMSSLQRHYSDLFLTQVLAIFFQLLLTLVICRLGVGIGDP